MKKLKWIIGILVILGLGGFLFGSGTGDWYAIFLFLAGVLLIIYGFKGRSLDTIKNDAAIPPLSREREQNYRDRGLSEHEVEIFRETLNQTRLQIEHLQNNVKKNAKLKAIDLKYDTLRASKALFKEMVNEPLRMHEASQFLYTHLPNMVELTDKYLEINAHEIKSREAYDKMEESIQIIDQVAALISQDYQRFVSDDLDDMDVELSIAKKSLTRDQTKYGQHEAR
ncbi:MAG TPA: 5-bromo-4-chloroindolyl phosphate hydrolysis family protein [Candidatus Tetragenococcus pullicola]|nr:5-bromo-4-chloroindolyl phosphate hydrolysis family protein [Candidatus Tetragenococcus pullicola]